MDQYSREFIAEKARLRPEDLGLVRTARRSHNQPGLAYQIAFIRLTGRASGQQPFEILEDLVGYVATELNANPRDLDLYARRQPTLSAHLERVREHLGLNSLQPAGASHADPTRVPQGRTATRPRPVRPLRPTGPTGSARLRTPNRRGELPASHPRSYHLLADSGDRSCFERGGLGCGRSQLRVTVPYQPDRVGQRLPLRRVPAQPQSRAKRKA